MLGIVLSKLCKIDQSSLMKLVEKYSRSGLGKTKLKCKMNAHEKHCTHWKVKVKTMVSEINVVAVKCNILLVYLTLYHE